MNEGPRWPENDLGPRSVGYLTTIADVDLHVNDGWLCLVWGPSSGDWEGHPVDHWLRRRNCHACIGLPEEKHAELLAFIIPFCQLHS